LTDQVIDHGLSATQELGRLGYGIKVTGLHEHLPADVIVRWQIETFPASRQKTIVDF
jgi:hypothetical protein